MTENGAEDHVGVNWDHHSKPAKIELKSFKGPVKQKENARDRPVKPRKVTCKASSGQKGFVLAFTRELMINTSSGVTTFPKVTSRKVSLLSLPLTCHIANIWTIYTYFQNKGRFGTLLTQIYLDKMMPKCFSSLNCSSPKCKRSPKAELRQRAFKPN